MIRRDLKQQKYVLRAEDVAQLGECLSICRKFWVYLQDPIKQTLYSMLVR